jgi:hypothetical protein
VPSRSGENTPDDHREREGWTSANDQQLIARQHVSGGKISRRIRKVCYAEVRTFVGKQCEPERRECDPEPRGR